MPKLRMQLIAGMVLGVSLGVSGCLTPQERSEVYGGRFGSKPKPTKVATPPKPVIAPKPTYRPPNPVLRPVNPRPVAPVDVGEFRPSPGDVYSCGAGEIAHLQGQPLSALNTMRFSQPIRIIRPGQMVTQDYSAQRLNFDITEQGVIGRLWCG